jgi:hypothetical protein
MPDNLDARIKEIELRLLSATPGVWRWIGCDLIHPKHNWELIQAAGSLEVWVPGSGEPPTVVLGVGPICLSPNTYEWIVPNRLADLEFIEHAKEDIAVLMAELKKCQDQLAELQ